jgi:MraZ protein
MFLGRYEHSIDDKGRLTIPARYREMLADGAYVTQGFDHNLIVHPIANFEQMSTKVNQLAFTDPVARQLKRYIFSTAEYCEIDKAGRILIPLFLRDIAQIDGNAVLVGAGNYFEIWSPEAWAHQHEALQDTDVTTQRFAELSLPS